MTFKLFKFTQHKAGRPGPVVAAQATVFRPGQAPASCPSESDTKPSWETASCPRRRRQHRARTILHHLHNAFSGAPGGDRKPGSGDHRIAAGCGLSTRGHWDGPSPGICNERAGDSARDATWRKAPCERAAAAGSALAAAPGDSLQCLQCSISR